MSYFNQCEVLSDGVDGLCHSRNELNKNFDDLCLDEEKIMNYMYAITCG